MVNYDLLACVLPVQLARVERGGGIDSTRETSTGRMAAGLVGRPVRPPAAIEQPGVVLAHEAGVVKIEEIYEFIFTSFAIYVENL